MSACKCSGCTGVGSPSLKAAVCKAIDDEFKTDAARLNFFYFPHAYPERYTVMGQAKTSDAMWKPMTPAEREVIEAALKLETAFSRSYLSNDALNFAGAVERLRAERAPKPRYQVKEFKFNDCSYHVMDSRDDSVHASCSRHGSAHSIANLLNSEPK